LLYSIFARKENIISQVKYM